MLWAGKALTKMLPVADPIFLSNGSFTGSGPGHLQVSTSTVRQKQTLGQRRGYLKKNTPSATSCQYQRHSIASFDDEFRSSRSVAIGLHRRYRDVVNGGFSKNLKEFVEAGVTAYAVGCTDEGLRKELLNVREVDGGLYGNHGRGEGSVGLKSKLSAEEVEECILWLSLVFLAIICSPPPAVQRWSTAAALSPDVQLQWKGFCTLITNAYYGRGMAWLPVQKLQLEQMAVSGYAEEASLVADRMRLIFATLERICPQWPQA